ncbi:class I SAM-dependent DNA methyltransferase [Plastoroseomonas arctica]|uniref:Methyltransferase domain-containing protein n=1 Tax=Plastoroseomonas arctica TaxID=1509237 RepID=A0AAF1JXI5_9PROT|nr:class I SAM-dependent methyltransferase [Plastoroseomonas arctica]MBR0656242.1 methyltransferase domain-containing protein [Plastoroseomonas arctica]
MESLPAIFFEDFYRKQGEDPWGFARHEYEQNKYAATLAALPRARYANAFEVGCSIGVLTRQVAERCDRLLAIDAVEAPLPAARARTADAPWVSVRRGRIPEDWPTDATFDLIILSEVLYYFSPADIEIIAARVLASLAPGGDVVLVHWLPVCNPPYSQTGDAAVEGFLAAAGAALQPISARREELYRMDVVRHA